MFQTRTKCNLKLNVISYYILTLIYILQIVPNLLLVKRDEVIGLLVCAIFLHPEQSQRDKLLQLLLNLKKKMEKEDRALIISGKLLQAITV